MVQGSGLKRRLLSAVVGATFALLVSTRIEAADDLLVSLDYEVQSSIPGCPGEAEFRQNVIQQLGRDPFREVDGKRVVVQLQAAERALEGRVAWRGPKGELEGEQKFSSPNGSCDDLASKMAFAIVVQIQLLSSFAATPAPPSPPPPPPPPAAPASSSAETPQVAEKPPAPAVASAVEHAPAPVPRKTERSLALGVGPFGTVGLGPGPTLGGRIFATLLLERTSFELGGEASAPYSMRQSDGSGFSAYSLALTMAGCGHVERFSGCLVGKLGRIHVQGFGVDVPLSAAGVSEQLGLRLGATQSLGGRFLALAHVDTLVLLNPWNVTLNQTTVWTTPRFAGMAGIDIAVRFR